MPEIHEIELKYIRDLIPEKLYSKLEEHDVITVGDVINLEAEDFRRFPYVGVKYETMFNTLKALINARQDEIWTLYRANGPQLLPFVYPDDPNIIDVFEGIVEDYLDIVSRRKYKTRKEDERKKRNVKIIRMSFGLRTNIYQREKVAIRFRLDVERIRQICHDFLFDIRSLIEGNSIQEYECSCRQEAVGLLRQFTDLFIFEQVVSEERILQILKLIDPNHQHSRKRNYLFLLLKAMGYDQIPATRYHLLRNNLLFSKDQFDYNLFLAAAVSVLKYLRKIVVPCPFDDLAIELLKQYDISDEMIDIICKTLIEIEKTDHDWYQVRFEYLPSINAYVYRLLYEAGTNLSREELLCRINTRLADFNKCVEMATLTASLKRNRYYEPVGRTGVWTLRSRQNTEKQINLILRTFRTLDRPLSVTEITQYINENLFRQDVKYLDIPQNLSKSKTELIPINFMILEESSGIM